MLHDATRRNRTRHDTTQRNWVTKGESTGESWSQRPIRYVKIPPLSLLATAGADNRIRPCANSLVPSPHLPNHFALTRKRPPVRTLSLHLCLDAP
ncbi:hypothetical protein D9619_006859 [Psilocybe cf. subviscida]|uniref:Uncharacterized protein n=1 Tax=Psilocybe cf. subviscida TaxID=2480587 RepID=A0A8H5B466_9AGAR|nr:hypothetical protein D9619_006859 [Psilocybe cf. subviscida]